MRRSARASLQKLIHDEDSNGTLKRIVDLEIIKEIRQIESWNDGSTVEYEEKLHKFKKLFIEQKELSRCEARQKLHDFINQETKQGGKLFNIDNSEKRNEMSKIKNWMDGSTLDYEKELEKWTEFALKFNEDLRIKAFETLIQLIDSESQFRGVLNKINGKEKKEITQLRKMKSESVEHYKSLTLVWKNRIEEKIEQQRLEACKRFQEFVKHEIGCSEEIQDFAFINELKSKLSWDNGTKEEYEEKTRRYQINITKLKENSRFEARSKLQEFIRAERGQGGRFEMITDSSIIKYLKELESWDNGTVSEYAQMRCHLPQEIESQMEVLRCEAMNNLHGFLNNNSEQNFDSENAEWSELINWQDGTTEEYKSKLEQLSELINKKKEKLRVAAREKLYKFIKAEDNPGGILFYVKNKKELRAMLQKPFLSISQYEEKYRKLVRYFQLHL